jgi:hypothetical protein
MAHEPETVFDLIAALRDAFRDAATSADPAGRKLLREMNAAAQASFDALLLNPVTPTATAAAACEIALAALTKNETGLTVAGAEAAYDELAGRIFCAQADFLRSQRRARRALEELAGEAAENTPAPARKNVFALLKSAIERAGRPRANPFGSN